MIARRAFLGGALGLVATGASAQVIRPGMAPGFRPGFKFIAPNTNGRLMTPTDLGAWAWLDGSDTSSYSLVSGVVQQWNDKSGNARNISQSNASYRPAPLANALNGMPALKFDAHSLLSPNTVTLAQPFSVIVLLQNSLGNLYNITFDGSTAYSGARAILFTSRSDRSSSPAVNAGGTAQVLGSSVQNTGPVILSATFDNTTTIGAFNGSPVVASSPGSGGIISGFTIGGNPADANNQMSATICEAIIIPNTTPLNVRKAEGILAGKWNVQSILTANHPYKTAAPRVS